MHSFVLAAGSVVKVNGFPIRLERDTPVTCGTKLETIHTAGPCRLEQQESGAYAVHPATFQAPGGCGQTSGGQNTTAPGRATKASALAGPFGS